MNFKLTILNVTAILFIVGCLVYTIVNYAVLSHAEGWGVVLMVGLIGYGLSALVVDLIIRNVFKKSKYQHWISAAAVLVYVAVLVIGLYREP